jgi:hypothetical protein
MLGTESAMQDDISGRLPPGRPAADLQGSLPKTALHAYLDEKTPEL